nr:copia protein (gag-int-pol protein) [Ipomoea trifida]
MASELGSNTENGEGDIKKTEPLKRVVSPYELNSNDNPGNVITQVRLRGDENYDEWARAMKTSLRARRKWGFVEGTILEPKPESIEYEDWWTVQSMLVSWIRNTIELELRSTISHMEDAKDLWNDIKERFSVPNGPRIHQIKTELSECKQHGLTIAGYFGKLKELWDDLASYEQMPVCECGGCKCNISTKLDKRREEEKLHQFLMGLDEITYGTVRSNILAAEPLPSLNKAYGIVIRDEKVKSMARVSEERGEPIGLHVQTGNKFKGKGDMMERTVTCSICKRTGHEASTCFQVIGYPDWWGDRPRGEGKSGGRGKATQRAYAGRGRGGGVRANAMHTSASNDQEVNPEVVEKNNRITGLNNEQWQTLLAALNACKGGLNETMTGKDDTWIIDTGASNHMTGNVNILHNVSNMTGCPVGLPDGRSTVATKKGLVNLDERLKMHNVLYVPELNCNLISVSQLIDDSNCIAQFTKDLCVIQDRTSRMLIGAGERRNGLYYFRKIPSIRVSKVDSGGSLELWHKRLGHPSLKVTKLVPVVDISDGNNLLHKQAEIVHEEVENESLEVRGGANDVADDTEFGEQLGRGHRTRYRSVKLRDFVTNVAYQLSPSPDSPVAMHPSGNILFVFGW